MTDLQSLLSALIRSERIPQVQIAEKAGVSQKHLSQMLNGRIKGTLTMWQAVLDAAGVSLPHLAPAAHVDADPNDADWACRVPAGDGGLREALEALAAKYDSELGTVSYHWLSEKTLKPLLAAHPAAPAVPQPACLGDGVCTNPRCATHGMTAVPQPVDREALERALRERMRNSNFADNLHEPIRTQTIDQWADLFAGTVLAVLAGEQEQVESP